MITKFDKYINEGIRDKMTPKSEVDILKNFQNISEPFIKSSLRTYVDSKEVCEILDESMENLYVIWVRNIDDEGNEIDDGFDLFNTVTNYNMRVPVIERNLRGENDYNEEEDTFLFYPEHKLMYFEPHDLQYSSAWIYSKLMINEYIKKYI